MQAILRKAEAWSLLPEQVRQNLYALLPAPLEGEKPHDVDVHPLKTRYKSYIEEEVRRWQEDLKEGREAKTWRESAKQAGKDRLDGKWDDWKEQQREANWGSNGENAVEPKTDHNSGVDKVVHEESNG